MKKCKRCGVVMRGEFNQFDTCRNTEACKHRVMLAQVEKWEKLVKDGPPKRVILGGWGGLHE